jgi:hypothetical protein
MHAEGSWERLGLLRALGLMLVTGALSIVDPGILVAIPVALMAIFLPTRFRGSLLVGALVAFLAFGGTPDSGLWYLERGWALLLGGWFLALTLRWPEGAFISRGLGAVGGTFAAAALLFWSRPGQWAVVDWAVTSKIEDGIAMVLQAVRTAVGPQVVPVSAEGWLLEVAALHGMIFPAMLGLASLAALGAAWWAYNRLNRAQEAGIGPLRDFRFNDQLVWILILGLLLLLGSSGAAGRMGTNAVVFMGVLYALRGVAVVLALFGGPTLLLGIVLVVAFLVAAPFFVAGAFVFGLGDTWLNLRTRGGGDSLPRGPGSTS